LFGLARLALADQPRAMGFPGRAQVGPVARLHWLDRQKSRGFVRELPHDRRIDVEMLRDEFGRRVRQPVRERDAAPFLATLIRA